jgi:hypothetical protein
MSTIIVKKIISDSDIEKWSNTFFSEKDIKIFSHNIDIYTEDNKILIKFRKNIITEEESKVLFENMKSAAPKNGGRAEASGKPEDGSSVYKTQVSKNGKTLRLLKKKVRSGIAGYYDNVSMFGHLRKSETKTLCRETSFNKKHLNKFQKCLHIFSKIDKIYKTLAPKEYNRQLNFVNQVNEDYIIDDTVFTTITVNKNFRTALHKDKGDFKEGLGNLLVCSKGKYDGSYTLFPQYGIGIDCKNTDFMVMNVHEWHCNSEMTGEGDRLSFVFYAREKMVKNCPRIM